jgi:hypothetical protein
LFVCWALPPKDYGIRFDPTFGSFYLTRTGFFGESVLECLNWNRCFFGVESVKLRQRDSKRSYYLHTNKYMGWRRVDGQTLIFFLFAKKKNEKLEEIFGLC